VEIQMSKIPPTNTMYYQVVDTSTTMIHQHPDTVQALVNAATEGWNYQLKYPNAAMRVDQPFYSNFGITSPEEMDYLFATNATHLGTTPALTKVGFTSMVTVLNASNPSAQFTMPFSQWVIDKFVDKAIKTYGYSYAT
jgi:ABC-type nitrate/sulfonate/bicarbonate transport system substrate-binding protein